MICLHSLARDSVSDVQLIYLFYLFNITDKGPERSLTCHTAMSQWLTQKEPVRYTNKLIKKTNRYKLQRILVVNKKNLIPANITMNDNRGQEWKGGV